MYGNDTIKCQHNGTWTNSPQCLERCNTPDIANSNISPSNITSYSNNSAVTVTCTDNAKMRGNDTVICNNGTWSHLPVCQIYKCYKPTIGAHAVIENRTEYLINSTYDVTCEMGYDGNVTAYCDRNGTWNITGNCGVQTCDKPKVIWNSDNTYNNTLIYSWNDTFIYR